MKERKIFSNFTLSNFKTFQFYGSTLKYLVKARQNNVDVERLKSEWVDDLFSRLGLKLDVKGNPTSQRSVLYVGNHISHLDIPILIRMLPDFSFVAKKQIASWPLFGSGAKFLNTIFVDRDSADSKNLARQSIIKELGQGGRVVIFPSGTTSIDETKQWKKGAFEIAKANNIKIQPFRISYFPLRTAAFIENDIFHFHFNRLIKNKEIYAKIEFHEPVSVVDSIRCCKKWKNWTGKSDNNYGIFPM